MTLGKTLLPEFDHEMAVTRKTLERVPEDRFDWKPHDKSMAMVGLTTHLANLPSWVALTMEADDFDIAPEGAEPPRAQAVTSVAEALERFDGHVAEARAALSDATDERMRGRWSLLAGGKPLFTLPRIAVLRSLVLSHAIHHRAQLGVYLRMNDVPVPSMYGPSADEGW